MQDRDWSKPVWYDTALLERYDAGEKAMFDNAVQQAVDAWEREEGARGRGSRTMFVRNGIAALMERVHLPIRYENDPH